ncbi:hypothetical protein CAEBREN_00989 [Caenorhabditis brenneri]|uniref:Uncharacterized protein n=1 Tax=Caenorhabditis brenneri TaxID=135651 RepID=G0PFN0_CAEBE|nr:hypothetical protein CAEBREN_00989 [Caenorhabditis brenneri]
MAQWAKDPFVKTKKKAGKKSQKSAAKKSAKQAVKKAPKRKSGPKKSRGTARPTPAACSSRRCVAVTAPAQPPAPSAVPPRAAPRRQPNAASARRGGSTTAARPARAPAAPATLPPPAAPQHPPNAATARRSGGTATRQPAHAPPAPATPPPAASGSLPTSAPSRGRGRAAAPAGRGGSTSAARRASAQARRSTGNAAPGGSSAASRPAPPPTTPRARPSAGPARKKGRAASGATPTPSASAPRASGTNDAAGPFPSSTSCTAPPKKRGRPPGSTKEALKRRRALARRSARGTSPQPSTSGAPPASPPTSRSTSAAPSSTRGRRPSGSGQVASSSRPRASRVRRASPSPRAPRSRSVSAEHGARTTRSAAALARFAGARTRAQRSAIQQTLNTSHAPAPRRSGSAGRSPTPPAPQSAPRTKRERLLAVSSSTQQNTPVTPLPVAATPPGTPPATSEGQQLRASPSPAYVPSGSANPSPSYWPQPEDQQPTGFFPFSPGAHPPTAQWTAVTPPANNQLAGQGSQSSSSTPRSVPSTSGLPPPRRATQRIPVVPNPLAPNRVQRLLANQSPPPPAQHAPITPDTHLSNGTDARDNRDPSPLAQQGRQQADFGTGVPAGFSQEARPHISTTDEASPPPAKRARPSDPAQNGLSAPQRPQPSTTTAPQPPPPQRYNSGFSSRRAVQPVAPQVRQPTGGIVSAAINRWMGTGSRRDVVVVDDDDDILIDEVVLAPPPREPQLCVPIGGGLDWRDWTPEQVVEWAQMWGAADGIIEEMRRTSMDGRMMDGLFSTNNNMADGRRFHFSNTQVVEMWNHITLVFRALRGSRPQR